LEPGQTVLTLGTGGVSVFAIQFAHAAGAKVLTTSSSDDKLAKVRAIGASETINYNTHPEWDGEVRRLTQAARRSIRWPYSARVVLSGG
jgi:NADPH:quinone reductase-like Zn-dependent oxidoreductase